MSTNILVTSEDQYLAKIIQCTACPLCKVRRRVVLGRGDWPADILLIGEGPGRSEDMLGIAFVGEAGKLMDKMLRDAGIDPRERCLFTNIVMCHPSDRIGGDNREPTSNEVAACMENVLYVADITQPKAVVLVGQLASKYYNRVFPAAFHIQHPAFLLRNGSEKSPYYLQNVRKLEDVREAIK